MQRIYREAARDVPIVQECDVLVCGGGPAGVAAALTAARTGARTRLIEVHGCLGGVWTAGLLSWIIDFENKHGLMREIVQRLEQREARALGGQQGTAYDAEAMKLLLEEMCMEAGVEVRLHTRVVAAARDDANRLSLAITESKSGREAWGAKVFVDATGDGDLAALSGCGFDYGRETTGETQPMSLMAILAGIHAGEVDPFICGERHGDRPPKDRFLAEMDRAGVRPSYGSPTLFRIRDDLFALMANHEYGVSALDAEQISAATLRARAEVHRQVDALRALGGPWRNVHIVATGGQIGVREGRRVHGRCTVSTEDVLDGARHKDAVCRVTFGIDVHALDPAKGTSYEPENRTRTQPYDIPLGALIARDVEGLLLAGRCISGDFLAHSSYRVTGNAVPLGEAAGVTAALAARAGVLPQAVPWAEVEAGIAAVSRVMSASSVVV